MTRTARTLQSAVIAFLLCLPVSCVFAQTCPRAEAVAVEPIRTFMIADGDSVTGSWDSDANANRARRELRSRFGGRFAWVQLDGHQYVVTDPAVLEEFADALQPQEDVNRRQSDVNRLQDDVNALQSKVNAHQEEVNAQQRKVKNEQDQEKVNGMQSQVNEEQERVNAEQEKVNARQATVNAEQERVSAEFNRRVQEIFASALRDCKVRRWK